jgi:hypothetical protein
LGWIRAGILGAQFRRKNIPSFTAGVLSVTDETKRQQRGHPVCLDSVSESYIGDDFQQTGLAFEAPQPPSWNCAKKSINLT